MYGYPPLARPRDASNRSFLQQSAVEFAIKYDQNGGEWHELLHLHAAIEHRQETFASPRGISENIEDLPSPPLNVPTVPAYPGNGFQYQGYGADLALELCRNSLDLPFTPGRSKIDDLVANSEIEAILLAVAHAWGNLLNP